MNSVLVVTNLVAASFIFIILVGLYQIPRKALKGTRSFRYCMWTCLVGLIAEAFAVKLDGNPDYAYITFGLNYVGYILLNVIIVFYAFYFLSIAPERARKTIKVFTYVLTVLCLLNCAAITGGAMFGKVYDIIDGAFVEGPWINYIMIIPVLALVGFFIIVIIYIFKFKFFKINRPVIVVMFIVIPGVATYFVRTNTNIRHGFIGAAISLNVVYVMIQSRIIAEAIINADIYNEMSVNDQLTGLKNRRGYQDIIDSVDPDAPVGIVFADVNSLKAVNDNKGHAAGDELIKRVADILKDVLVGCTVCRISGDEFVGIIENPGAKGFEGKMNKLRETLMANDRVASFGYATGLGRNFLEVVKAAEKKMYSDKESYYKETGRDRRR